MDIKVGKGSAGIDIVDVSKYSLTELNKIMEEKMDKETLKKRIAVEQACLDGAVIEFCSGGPHSYTVTTNPCYDWSNYDYRVKQTPKYIPYTMEDIDNMKNRVIVDKHGVRRVLIWWSDRNTVVGGGSYTFEDLLDKFTHIDGTPFGKLEEL